MMTEKPKWVRFNRTPFSEQWEVVRVNDAGVIVQRWQLHPDDAAVLETVYRARQLSPVSRVVEESP